MIRGLVWVAALGLTLAACGEGGEQRTLAFDDDPESVRVVRSIREGLSQGLRPDTEEARRLREITLRYPGDEFVGETLMRALEAFEDSVELQEAMAEVLRAQGDEQGAEEHAARARELRAGDAAD